MPASRSLIEVKKAGASLALFLLMALALAACTLQVGLPSIGESTPSPKAPSLPRIAAVSAPAAVQLGPIVVKGMYCWREGNQGPLYARLVFFNPTAERLAVRVEHGVARISAQAAEMTDRLQLAGGDCTYAVHLLKSEPENTHLTAGFREEAKGVLVAVPMEDSRQVLENYFADLKRGDVEALRRYVEPTTTVQDLARQIAWRSTVEPVQLGAGACSPVFDFDPTGQRPFRLMAWDCEVSAVLSVYSPRPDSATWNGQVRQDTLAGKWVLAERPR